MPYNPIALSRTQDTIASYSPKAWYSASQLKGYANSQRIPFLPDISGNGFHLAQNTVSAMPTVILNQKNGLPIIRFNSASSQTLASLTTGFGTAASLYGNPAFSFFAVYKKTTVNKGHLFGWGNASSSLAATGLYDDNSTSGIAFAGGNTWGVTSLTNSTWYIVEYHKTASSTISAGSSSYANGSANNTGSPPSTNPNISGTLQLVLGQWASSTSNQFTGDFAELIIFQGSAGLTNRTTILSALNIKWAIY